MIHTFLTNLQTYNQQPKKLQTWYNCNWSSNVRYIMLRIMLNKRLYQQWLANLTKTTQNTSYKFLADNLSNLIQPIQQTNTNLRRSLDYYNIGRRFTVCPVNSRNVKSPLLFLNSARLQSLGFHWWSKSKCLWKKKYINFNSARNITRRKRCKRKEDK